MEDQIAQITEMGFTRSEAEEALKFNDNDVYKAVDWIFNRTGSGAVINVDTPMSEIGHVEDANLARTLQYSMDYQNDSRHTTTPIALHEFQQSSQAYEGIRSQQQSGEIIHMHDDGDNEVLSDSDSDVQIIDTQNNDTGASTASPMASNENLGPVGGGQFGPATRESYEAGQWGVVPYSTGSGVVVEETWMSEPRFRAVDELPLLLPSLHAVGVAPMLMILHSIPLAREAIVNSPVSEMISDYGYAQGWWRDVYIDMARQFVSHPELAEGSTQRFVVEAQRLMAFLDGGSRRPYTSIVNLAEVAPPTSSKRQLRGEILAEGPVGKLLQDLSANWSQSSPYYRTFSTHAVSLGGDPDSLQNQNFTELVVEETMSGAESLYDVLDDMTFGNDEAGAWSTHLYDIADVVSITIRRQPSALDVPLVWFPDRYRKELRPYINEAARLKNVVMTEVSQLNTARFQLATIMGKDASKLIEASLDFLKDSPFKPENPVSFAAAIHDIERVQSEYEAEKTKMASRIDMCQRMIREYDAMFKKAVTKGSEDFVESGQPAPELRPYHLVGVVVTPTYFLCKRPADPSLIELDDSSEPENDQTWYSIDISQRPVVLCVSEESVTEIIMQQQVRYDNKGLTLVYANEYALNQTEHSIGLSEKLQQFVERDRRALLWEMKRAKVAAVHVEEVEPQEEAEKLAVEPLAQSQEPSHNEEPQNLL